MDRQSAVALGVTAGIGVGLLLGQIAPSMIAKPKKQQPMPARAVTDNEVERLIRPNILALTPYRCARDDYDQGRSLTFFSHACGG